MSEEWLATESFERAHKIISAINTLSIHAKLTMADVEDTASPEEIAEARGQLDLFLDRFEHIVSEVEENQEAPVLGVDPGLNMLAQQFVAAKHQWPHSTLYDIPLDRFKQLVHSERMSDLSQLIECLRTLRSLVEQNAHSDVVGVLGEL
jgi:hypothetical protein